MELFSIDCPSYSREFNSIFDLVLDLIDSGYGFCYGLKFDNELTGDELDEIVGKYYYDLI